MCALLKCQVSQRGGVRYFVNAMVHQNAAVRARHFKSIPSLTTCSSWSLALSSARFWNASRMYTSPISASCDECVSCVCFVCMWERERDIASSHMQLFSLSHPHCCHPPIPTVNQPPWQLCLRRWHNGRDWSYLLSCVMGGVCVCVCVCVGLGVSVSSSRGLSVCFLSPHLQAECLSLLSLHPSLFLFSIIISTSPPLPLPPLPESPGHCGAERCWVLFSRRCQLSPRPSQDKAVIAPGTAGRGSSSSKQICSNFICNWALNWEQIEAALWSSGKGEGSELGVVGEAGEMILGSFMSGKVGLLSGREPRQGSYFWRKLEHLSPALHLDKNSPCWNKKRGGKKSKDRYRSKYWSVCVCVCLHMHGCQFDTHTAQTRQSSTHHSRSLYIAPLTPLQRTCLTFKSFHVGSSSLPKARDSFERYTFTFYCSPDLQKKWMIVEI